MGAHRILGGGGGTGKMFLPTRTTGKEIKIKNVGYVLFLLYYSRVLFVLDERYHVICG